MAITIGSNGGYLGYTPATGSAKQAPPEGRRPEVPIESKSSLLDPHKNQARNLAAQLTSGEGLSTPRGASSAPRQTSGFAGALGSLVRGGNPIREEMDKQGVPAGVGIKEAIKARAGVQLSAEEKKQVGQAAQTAQKLAGKDGLWNGGDLGNNVNQLQKGGVLKDGIEKEIDRQAAAKKSGSNAIGRALVDGYVGWNRSSLISQNTGEARVQAGQQLAQGLTESGVRPTAGAGTPTLPLSKRNPGDAVKMGSTRGSEKPTPLEAQPITSKEMDQFKSATAMLKARSQEQGLPVAQFPQGVPVAMFSDIAAGRSPQQTMQNAGAILNWGKDKSGNPMLQQLRAQP